LAITYNPTTGGILEPARKLAVAREVDVLVVGGGTSGCAAAIAAARHGARVLLVERYGFLGGTATAAMVGVFCGVYTCGPDATHQTLVGGIPLEVMQRMERIGAGYKYRHRFQIDHEVFKLELDRWLEEAGVEILLHAIVVETLMRDGAICGVVVEHKGGREAILARRVVDASGDGDVAALAGAPYEKSEVMQAPTMVFNMGGVDVARAMAFPEREIRRLLIETQQSGIRPCRCRRRPARRARDAAHHGRACADARGCAGRAAFRRRDLPQFLADRGTYPQCRNGTAAFARR